ncbi:hypothetical protein [Branchiibius hedensis]|nr:hypothetical protein [Branchiibius hedensis]
MPAPPSPATARTPAPTAIGVPLPEADDVLAGEPAAAAPPAVLLDCVLDGPSLVCAAELLDDTVLDEVVDAVADSSVAPPELEVLLEPALDVRADDELACAPWLFGPLCG